MSDGPHGTTPWRRDPGQLAVGLAAWVGAHRTPDTVVSEVAPPDSGMANETILFRAGDERLVARLSPLPGSPFPTFPVYDLDTQRRCLELVGARTEVPVPEVVALEQDPSWLGAPFLVLKRIDGVVPSDNPPYVLAGWLCEATARQRRRLEETSIATLVALHQLTPETVDLKFLGYDGSGANPLDQQLAYQRSYYDWARDDTVVPVVEEAFERLAATRPNPARTTFNWGDSRIGNILFRDFEPAAVLDWEMATVGPPEVDLGWMTFFHTFFQTMAETYGFAGLPDLLERERAVATYERLAGHGLDDLGWYEALAALRFAIISIRLTMRSVAFGQVPPPEKPDDLIMFGPLFRRLLGELSN